MCGEALSSSPDLQLQYRGAANEALVSESPREKQQLRRLSEATHQRSPHTQDCLLHSEQKLTKSKTVLLFKPRVKAALNAQ